MMPPKFIHLHVHTEYSLLDGMCRIPQLITRAKDLGMDSLAITDHGTMYGAIDFYLAAKEAGIKPIIGCEVYVAETDCHIRDPNHKNYYHLTLLAKNETGYCNLIQLVTKSHLEGFYYKPRVDKKLLELHHDGLIALSGCAHGELARLILANQFDEVEKAALWYKKVFTDYYLEIQRHPIPELEQINQVLVSLSAKLNIPQVATFDVHYIDRKDAPSHELMLCIQTNTSINDEKRLKMAGDFFYLKSPDEVDQLFQDLPEAIENSQRIADMCQLELDFTKLHLPKLSLPQDTTADAFLAEISWQGLEDRYPESTCEVKDRLNYELDVIKQTNFADYFLVVWDIISFAKKRDIYFGVRGSAAASLVLYCLGITDIDPLTYKLVFERFLNVERHEMPDIDLDFQDDRREEVLDYVNQQYGSDHVAQIITFGTLGARAALRDTGRALGLAYAEVDRVAKLIPTELTITLDKALRESRELNEIYYQDEAIRNLIDSARKLEGAVRHASTHAAGVVISRDQLTNYVPLQMAGKEVQGSVMTQFHMGNIARLGLLKMDFLGLSNLTILAKAEEIIEKKWGLSLDLRSIPLDDAKTFELFASGETQGIFQLESTGMRRYIKELKPTKFSDIAAMVALYRPGPMEQIPTFIKAKQGAIPVHYAHPALEEILKETYGVIVYQEQVLFIAQALAGYSLGEADILRKAMGKKIPEVMKKEQRNFLSRAKNRGIPQELAKDVFSLIEPFAGYAFNKAHSVSYALIAYRTAYLKANYPVEYITAFLNTYSNNMEKVRSAVAECRRLGIQVLAPDINESQAGFTIEALPPAASPINGKRWSENAIRFGLANIKNVGASPIKHIVSARDQGGSFKSIEDFCHRASLPNINRKVMESLIKSGAFDSLGSRKTLIESIDKIISLAQAAKRMREAGQTNMFALWTGEESNNLGSFFQEEDVPIRQKLLWEKELLGVYFSQPFAFPNSDPSGNRPSFYNSLISCGEINMDMEGETVTLIGMVTSLRQAYTRDKQPFVVATLEDLNGDIEVIVWPKVYKNTRGLWQESSILTVKGIVKVRDREVQLNCQEAEHYTPQDYTDSQSPQVSKVYPEYAQETLARQLQEGNRLHITIDIVQTEEIKKDIERMRKIIDILKNYPGEDEVSFTMINGDEITDLEMPNVTVKYCPEMANELNNILDENSLSFVNL